MDIRGAPPLIRGMWAHRGRARGREMRRGEVMGEEVGSRRYVTNTGHNESCGPRLLLSLSLHV